MAIPITGIRDFHSKFEAHKHQSDLFAYFLFDDRMSHEAVEKFAKTEFLWLDGLASAAKIFFFIFVRPDFEEGGRVVNPSPDVGRMFGIMPNQLPGVVLFTLSADKEGVSDGVFLPLDAKLFKEDVDRVEEIFSDLFSIIQECKEGAKPPTSFSKSLARITTMIRNTLIGPKPTPNLLKRLEAEIARLKRRESMKPVWSYFNGNVISLLNFPKAILDATCKAIGEGIAKKALGG